MPLNELDKPQKNKLRGSKILLLNSVNNLKDK